jgi:hypothetical protein
MNWLTTIIFVAIIASILGALNSKDKEKREEFLSGLLLEEWAVVMLFSKYF